MMFDYLWRVQESTPQRLALAPLTALEGLYRVGALLHRRAYDLGVLRRARLAARVIAIGNLAVGGSGKTPLTAFLAASLRARGRKVAVLCRGVGGRANGVVNVVSDGERVLAGPDAVGDEPLLVARAAAGVPVLAGRNRVALGLRATAMFGSEVLLLDDAFQHHRCERDLDLVCVDGALGLGNGHCLPRGPLREPSGELARAHALVFTRVRPGSEDPPGAFPPRPPRFRIEIAARALADHQSGERLALETLRGRSVGVLAAIARPDRLRADLEGLGARVLALRAFADHHRYQRSEIEALDAGHPWVITGKDAVKIPPEWSRGRRLWVLEEEVRSETAQPLVDWIEERLDHPRDLR